MVYCARNNSRKKRKDVYSWIKIIVVLIIMVTCRSAAAQIGQANIEETQAVIKIMEIQDEVISEEVHPEKGYKFVGIQVLIDNTEGVTAIEVYSRDFALKDAEGYWYNAQSRMGVIEPALQSTDVEAGDVMRGWIYFEVPATGDVSRMRLRYGESTSKSAWIPLSENVDSPGEFLRDDLGSQELAHAKIANTETIVRITAVKNLIELDEGNFIQVEKDKKYVGIEMLIDNTRSTVPFENANLINFRLKDAEGYEYGSGTTMGVVEKLALPLSDIEAGEFVKGWYYFKVPITSDITSMKVRYDHVVNKSAWMSLSGDSATPGERSGTEGPPGSVSAKIQDTNTVVRVTNLKDAITSENQRVQPEEGQKFIGIDVIIDNTRGTERITVYPNNFMLKDADGFEYSSNRPVMLREEPELLTDNIEVGDFIRGWIYFQVPVSVDMDTARLRYDDSPKKSDWIALSEVSERDESSSSRHEDELPSKEITQSLVKPEQGEPEESTQQIVIATPQTDVTPTSTKTPLAEATPKAEPTPLPGPDNGGETPIIENPSVQLFLRFLGLLLLMMVVPMVIHHMFKVPHASLKNGILGGVAVLTYSIRHFSTVLAESPAVKHTGSYIADVFFLSVLLYSLLIGLHYERRVAWSKKKKVAINLLIFTIISLSVLLYDKFYANVMPFFPVIYSGIGILFLYCLITIVFGTSVVPHKTQSLLFSKITPGEDAAPLAFDDIVEYASDIVANEEFYKQYNISPREQEVLLLLLQGKSNNEIGETLYVSRNTIKTHIRNIYAKLGVNNRYELIYMLKQANQSPSSE
jgi:DNA-binding CsgD family transcriptional regulator